MDWEENINSWVDEFLNGWLTEWEQTWVTEELQEPVQAKQELITYELFLGQKRIIEQGKRQDEYDIQTHPSSQIFAQPIHWNTVSVVACKVKMTIIASIYIVFSIIIHSSIYSSVFW